MIDTKLLVELEKLFKKEPFNYENTKFLTEASYGSVKVNPDEDKIESLEYELAELREEYNRLNNENEELKELIELQDYYKDILDENGIDYD